MAEDSSTSETKETVTSPPKSDTLQNTSAPSEAEQTEQTSSEDGTKPAASSSSSSSTDRLARFKALQARAKKSATQNLKEAAAESQRLATDTTALQAVARKHAVASHNLLKADADAAGEDFERKRAWDWTAEEAERWDRRQAKKARNRADVAFRDYGSEAQKVYKRQLREQPVDADAYALQKADAVRRAAASGGLQLVEDEESGELVAVDRDGTFLTNGSDGSDFTQSRPSKEGIDRLVNNLKKAEEQRLKARRNRKNAGDDDPDITFINEKNKQFNMKLARFYNKYTSDIRESFERGTMI